LQKIDNLKVIVKVFTLCLIFILIIVYISIQSIMSLNATHYAFESFYLNQFNSVKNLNNIAKKLLQIRVNMLQEKRGAERGNLNEIRWRQEYSNILTGDCKKIWADIKNMNQTEKAKKLTERWFVIYSEQESMRIEFHKAINAGHLAKSESILAKWLTKYRELRDQTYRLIELHEKIGNEIKNEIENEANSLILRSYILMAASIFIGFIITYILARFFIKSNNINIKF
jgi:hypothetical protein